MTENKNEMTTLTYTLEVTETLPANCVPDSKELMEKAIEISFRDKMDLDDVKVSKLKMFPTLPGGRP